MTTSEELKKAVKLVPETSLVLQEFLAVIAGKKPVLAVTFPDKSQRELIKSNFSNLNIYCSKKPCFSSQQVCAISRDKSLAKQTAEYLSVDTREQGRLLGYPECCVKQHADFSIRDLGLNAPLIVYQSYKNSKKCSFLTNNLLNFYSRLGKEKKNFEHLNKYYYLNRSFPVSLWNLQFISHTPCSYDCKESIKMGKEVQKLLKKYAPDIEKIVSYTLSKPVLFFDLFKWIIFEGKVKESTLFYKRIIPPISLVESSFFDIIKKGNKVVVDENKVEILRDNLSLYLYSKKNEQDGFILDFNKKE